MGFYLSCVFNVCKSGVFLFCKMRVNYCDLHQILSAREQEVSVPGRYYPTPPHPIVPPRMVNKNAYFTTTNFNRRGPTTWVFPPFFATNRFPKPNGDFVDWGSTGIQGSSGILARRYFSFCTFTSRPTVPGLSQDCPSISPTPSRGDRP